jgi:hypothetical protein
VMTRPRGDAEQVDLRVETTHHRRGRRPPRRRGSARRAPQQLPAVPCLPATSSRRTWSRNAYPSPWSPDRSRAPDAVAIRDRVPHRRVRLFEQRGRVAPGRGEGVVTRPAEPDGAERPGLAGRDDGPGRRQGVRSDRPLADRRLEQLPADPDGQDHREQRGGDLADAERLGHDPLAECPSP